MSRKATNAPAKPARPAKPASPPKSPPYSRKEPARGHQAASRGETSTKAAQVLAALRTEAGASLTELGNATGWQAHSIRGFLSGTVRRKLGLDLRSEVRDGVRRYRVV
jgi:hypothetical protein